jgi:hypothetical protein
MSAKTVPGIVRALPSCSPHTLPFMPKIACTCRGPVLPCSVVSLFFTQFLIHWFCSSPSVRYSPLDGFRAPLFAFVICHTLYPCCPFRSSWSLAPSALVRSGSERGVLVLPASFPLRLSCGLDVGLVGSRFCVLPSQRVSPLMFAGAIVSFVVDPWRWPAKSGSLLLLICCRIFGRCAFCCWVLIIRLNFVSVCRPMHTYAHAY